MFGLFEDETVVSVSTSVSRVISDKLLPNAIKTGAIKGIISGGDQLVENIMEDAISSIGIKAERMYRYAKNGYIYGAPTSHIVKSSSVDAVAKAVIETAIGRPVTLEYVHYASLNRQHYGWQSLLDSYGYEQYTNEIVGLSATKGTKVYLEDMQIMISPDTLSQLSGSALERWSISASSGYTPLRLYSGSGSRSHKPFGIPVGSATDYLKVTYIWKTAEGIQRDTLDIPLPPPGENATYVQAKYAYTLNTPNPQGSYYPDIVSNHIKYFTYRIGDGMHVDLDNLFTTTYDELGSFFPFCYFRYNKEPTSTDPNSQEYKSSAKLLKYLKMDYVQVNEAINSNPQINDVYSALLMMAVPAVTADPLENRYLFDFFRGIYVQSGAVVNPGEEVLPYSSYLMGNLMGSMGVLTPPRVSFIIQDSKFYTTLGMSGIFRKLVPGVLGKVGTYVSVMGTITQSHTAIRYESDIDGIVTETSYTWDTQDPVHYYRKQITEHLFEEISVHNLRRTYHVDGGHATTNDMIPLDHSITENYSTPDREHLYARSLHYVFNSRKETSLAWYQQDWFGTLLLVIAIAWTAISMGADGGSGLAAAIAAGTVTLEMIVVAIIVTTIEALIIKMVAKLFVKMLGPEFAMLLAVVAAAYGMYFSPTSAAGSLESMVAQNLLSVSNSLIAEVSEGYKKSMELLKEDGDQFNLYAKAKTDELEKIQEELEGSRLLNPFILCGEAPDCYFNRTVHSGNIGINGISAIENYCAMSLRLPEIEQTTDFGQA